jgi:Fe-S-cluster-containing hydrogenase component 2
MLICSFVHNGSFSYKKARIRVITREDHAEATPIICRHCDDAPCIEACPEKAIFSDPKNGTVQLREDLCIGCKSCLAVCPYEAIFFDDLNKTAFKCDLCGGNPECVRVCELPQALQFCEENRAKR